LIRDARVGTGMEVAARTGIPVAPRLQVPEQSLAEPDRPLSATGLEYPRLLESESRYSIGSQHVGFWRGEGTGRTAGQER